MTTTTFSRATPDEMLGRIFDSLVGTPELFCAYVWDQIGFYRLPHIGGPATPPELALRAGTAEG